MKVYTWPDCPNCEKVKTWLSGRGIEYEVLSLTTDAQVEFIMRNIFGSPPLVEKSTDEVLISEKMFKGHDLDTDLLEEFLR